MTIPILSIAQASIDFEIDYRVNQINSFISISTEDLKEVKRIGDLNHFYKPSWISAFISVEVIAYQNNEAITAFGKSDLLTVEQKSLIDKADYGSDITINVNYIPNNTLTQNDPKLFDFTFTIQPETKAKFPGGAAALMDYLNNQVINKIETSKFKQYQLTAVKFMVNKEGAIENVKIFESSKDPVIDDLLKNAIRKMPCWSPAQYTDGTKVAQEFVLTAGDHTSCVINLLNIEKNLVKN